MKGTSHAIIGFGAVLAVHAYSGPMATSIVDWVPLLAAALAGALLPDIDSDESAIRQATATAPSKSGCFGKSVSLALRVFGGHRALTHTLIAWALISMLAGMYFYGDMRFVAFSVAYLSHLLADALTVQGVPLLWPLWPRRISFLPKLVAIRTGGVIETLVVIAASALVLRGLLP